jgi:hypothetical protein
LTYSGKHGSRFSRRLRLAAGVLAAAGLAALPLATGTAASASPAPQSHGGVLSRYATQSLHGLPWVTGPRTAATDVSYFLSSGLVAIKGGGHTWDLQLLLDKADLGFPEPATATVSITTPYKGGQEAHSWAFGNLPSGEISVNGSKGTASASTGTALDPIVTLSVAFKPTSHSVYKCKGGGTETTYNGKLTGSVKLTTGLHGLVLSKTGATFGQPSQFQVSTDFCVPTPCTFADWEATSAKSTTKLPYTLGVGVDAGLPPHQHFYADVEKLSQLAKPKGTLRGDGSIMNTANPVFSKSSKKYTVTTSKSGAVTGTMVIGPAKASKPETFSCSVAGTSYTETDVSYTGKYSGAITAHTMLTGNVGLGKTGEGGFDIITSFKKK